MKLYYPIPSRSRDPNHLPPPSSFDARGLASALSSREAERSTAGGIALPAYLDPSA